MKSAHVELDEANRRAGEWEENLAELRAAVNRYLDTEGWRVQFEAGEHTPADDLIRAVDRS